MYIDISEGSLKQGVLGLLLALVEIIKDALKIQALKRIEGDSLTEDEIERLGNALHELEEALVEIEMEHNLQNVVQNIREGLDNVVNEVVDTFNPERWIAENEFN
ncbi:conserved hypothetical protein [Desulfofarcimen acetoxidans DSM 771]|jgi:hypothetical protein|uniref:Gas vesicle K n=1 Tax=Desulfofarcimen acetoxidans (strain ATCC 49208 / DSM 771 / KCTC 5769 / VKM B-1644 / 5575) TaxID=485916 RepID=C8W3J0_DESAS|nr:gas vesicle protein GvpK [Desulfofarcimen acetoxidans]ACV63776.1 conserved hypothetical protein [Desulfofarcimen acetoxidans DSM 771]